MLLGIVAATGGLSLLIGLGVGLLAMAAAPEPPPPPCAAPAPPDETEECAICYRALQDPFDIQNCGHRFCRVRSCPQLPVRASLRGCVPPGRCQVGWGREFLVGAVPERGVPELCPPDLTQEPCDWCSTTHTAC